MSIHMQLFAVYYDNAVQQCVDQRNDCLLFFNICDHPSYEWYMKCSCRRTCNRCSDYMTNKANGNIAVTVNNNWMGGPGQWRNDNRLGDRNRGDTTAPSTIPTSRIQQPPMYTTQTRRRGNEGSCWCGC